MYPRRGRIGSNTGYYAPHNEQILWSHDRVSEEAFQGLHYEHYRLHSENEVQDYRRYSYDDERQNLERYHHYDDGQGYVRYPYDDERRGYRRPNHEYYGQGYSRGVGQDYSRDHFEEGGYNRFHQEGYNSERLQRSPQRQQEHFRELPQPVSPLLTRTGRIAQNLPADWTESVRPIPTIHGQGFSGSPSKKWFVPTRRPNTARHLINQDFTPPGRLSTSSSVQVSKEQDANSFGKHGVSPTATVTLGHRSQADNTCSLKPILSLSSLKSHQSPTITCTQSNTSTTTSLKDGATPRQETNTLATISSLSKQQSGHSNNQPDSKNKDNQTWYQLPLIPFHDSSMNNSLRSLTKFPEHSGLKTSANLISGKKLNSQQVHRPKVLVDIELVKKMEKIELGKSSEESKNKKDLPKKEPDSESVGDKSIDTGISNLQAVTDDEKYENVGFIDVSDVQNDPLNTEKTVPCTEHNKNSVGIDLLDITEERNGQSVSNIISHQHNQDAGTEHEDTENGAEDSSLIKGEPSAILKSKDEGVSNGETVTEVKDSEEKLCPVKNLQRRVLEKITQKSSLVKNISDSSLKALQNRNSADSSSSLEDLVKDGSYMEMDDSFGNHPDTNSSLDTSGINFNADYTGELSLNTDGQMDEVNLDQSLTGTTDIEPYIEDESDGNKMDTLESEEVTEKGDAAEENTDMKKSPDVKLKRKYNIKEVYVSLGNIDKETEEANKENVVDEQKNAVDNQKHYVDTQQMEADNLHGGNGNQQIEETIDEEQGDVLVDNSNEMESFDIGKQAVHKKPSDATEADEETKCHIACVTLPKMKDVKCEHESKENDALKSSLDQRKVIPLSERFGKLVNRAEAAKLEDTTDDSMYKADFENLVNKLNKKTETSDEVGSKFSHEDMDVDKVKNDIAATEPDTVIERDMETREREKKNEMEGVASPIQSGSSIKFRDKAEMMEVKPDRKATSPVSFLDCSDESDDELLAPSAFLRSIEEINGRPLVITPTKVIDSSQNSNATFGSNDLSPLKPVAQRPGLKNKFTLDGLLADHEEKADLVREMDVIDQELQDEIKQGGFVNILNKEDAAVESQITEEQNEMLKQFEVEESRICEDRPGVLVFDPLNYQCLFSSMLHPADCGYTLGSNGLSLEKHIESLTPAHYKRLITSGIISQCFMKISCQTPVMRWLFFIMSVHDDYQVQQGCKKMLLEILHYQHVYGSQKWAPRLVDVLSVLVNYGACLESLIPCGSSTLDIIRGKLLHQSDYNHQGAPQNGGMQVENLILVLQILAQCLNGPSGRYSPNDLSLLCVALCKASLDTSLKNLCAKGAFQNCITMVIRQYLDADWLKERLKLTRMLVSITEQHHNSAHIAELFPPGERGMFLQRRFCYLVLSEILLDKTNVSDDVLSSIQIKDLEKFIWKIKELLESDSYKLSSVVTLIDLCVGVHISLNTEQREQLKCLLDQVRRVRVRDNVSMLDRTRVKDMIVRMTSKWALDIQTMKGKQTKIFEYASPVKMHIEPVHAIQSSGEEEEDQSDSDGDLPCKIQKLSQET